MTLCVVFLVHDVAVSSRQGTGQGGGDAPAAGVDPSTLFGQVASIIGALTAMLVVAIKWKEKKIKGRNRDAFQHLMKSRR